MSGSKGSAETGQLLTLASGPPAAQAVAGPAFAAIGRQTVCLGTAGQGSRMKLVVNAYTSTLIEGVAEALELAKSDGQAARRAAASSASNCGQVNTRSVTPQAPRAGGGARQACVQGRRR